MPLTRPIIAFFISILTLFLTSRAPAQTPYQTPDAPLLGSAWYPEQWPESTWDRDLTLMEQAHFNVVRIGEFAWSTDEPREGLYTLDWLARAIALAAKHHLRVVLGTPTDAPPAWLTTRYPETLGMNADGHRREHGGRRQFNYADPTYRRLCREIVTALAKRFGHDPAVIGWQIGNEFTDESFDPATVTAFQQFLHTRYGTLANLNQRWSTAYWSQTYTDWSQIPMANTGGNPGLLLEHKHFVTATWRSFELNQADALRPLIAPGQFITTNIGGLAWSDNWDHYAITAPLDLATWDDYVNPGPDGQLLDPARNAMLNDFVRGWKRQNFWVMETEPGSVNWAPVNNALPPGETAALAWQTIGHGADAVLYWQWRDALNGQEQYHGAIVGPDGAPLPIYAELAALGRNFGLIRTALAGTSPHAEVALLTTYDSRWAIDFQPHTHFYDQQDVLLRFYTPLARMLAPAGQSVDLIDPTAAPLSGYKLLIAPSLNVIDEALAARLLAYVEAGGHLLLGPRSGMKDAFNALNPQRQPGPLARALGAKVEQYYALEQNRPVGLSSSENATPQPAGNASIWAETLTPSSPDTHILLRYAHATGWLSDQPAMVARSAGQGSIAYLGTLPDPALLNDLLRDALDSAHIAHPTPEPPAGIEICMRQAASATYTRRVWIVINHGTETRHVTLAGHLHNLLPGVPVQLTADTTALELAPQAVAVLTSEPAS